MSLHTVLFLIALLVPLSIDTFVLSAALGLAGIPKRRQLRTSLILAGFEAGMPIVGVLIGHGLGHLLGNITGYAAGAVIALVGLLMLRPSDESQEEKELQLLERSSGWKVIYLGLAISIDGLAVGLTLGLIHVSIIAVVIGMAVLAFAASRSGLKLGARLGARFREDAENLAGGILLLVGIIMLVLKLSGHSV